MIGQNFKIGLYIRVSTQEQADNPEGSIKNQQDRLKEAVNFKNMSGNFGEISDIFVDEARSGKDTNRPELKRMLEAIKLGKINLVMVSELSRISRNIQDFSEIWNLMKSKNCSFFSLRENFDTTTAAGEMVLYTLANLAQFERRQVSERVSANFLARAKRGLRNGGPVPTGYKLVPDKPGYLDIDEEEALIVKKCFEYFLEEETLALAAKRLNKDNFKLPNKVKGGRVRMTHFTVENLYRILTNKAIIGIRTYQEHGKECEAKAVWKGIISKSLFKEVEKKLKANHRTKKPIMKSKYAYIFSGLVYCLDCGDKLCGKSAHGRNGKVGYYEHGWRQRKDFCKTNRMHNCSSPTRFPAIKVHDLVIAQISKTLNSPEIARDLLLRAKKLDKREPIKKEIRRLENKKVNLERKLEVIVERISELPKDVSAKSFYSKMQIIQKQMEELQKEIDKKRRELKSTMEEAIDETTWTEFLSIFSKIFKTHMNPDQQNKLIRKLIHKIELGAKNVIIHYYIGQNNVTKGLAELSAGPLNFFENFGSNTLTNGGRGRD